ncbi:MAG: hypothetical protein KH899_06030 [Haemophilus pittmaniae]|uniref:hypothetical protein n=1 Tax=Haemophilus pittmaniae TaxID=249188 RepID=UPI0023F47602|nr:hypothetical protein [Haemophilus pittmaniae]MBS6027131.1 hypothetical protein [Haemophilus pittmaniae]
MLRIQLEEDRPGYAKFTAMKWSGSAEVEIAVQRNQDGCYFNGNGNPWNPEPVWHKVEGLNLENDVLQGVIGKWLVDSLVQQIGNVRYMMSVRDVHDSAVMDNGPVRMVGNILASLAGGDSSREDNVQSHVQYEPEPEPEAVIETPVEEDSIAVVEVEQATEPAIEFEDLTQIETPNESAGNQEKIAIAEEPKKKGKGGLIALILALLIGGGVGAYFLLNKKDEPIAKSDCAVDANTNDELAFIQSCLKTKPEPKQILEIIASAKQANKCAIAQRLYANQAQGGNVEIALAYAAEYEKGSSCFQADKETAIYWYETALSHDSNNATAKEKLEALKK